MEMMLNCVLQPNPSTIIFNGDAGGGNGDEPFSQYVQITDDIVDQYSQTATVTTPLINPNELLHHQYHMLNNPNFFDPCVNAGELAFPPPPPPLMDPAGFVLMPKLEPYGCNIDFSNSLIGLDLVGLGRRAYLSSGEDDFVSRPGRRSRQVEDSPPCQVEGCNANLSYAKHYHRRHKVCEFHSKASIVFTGGLSQRFCQQCSRFHILSEFDEGKRSCRKRLADHNRRRRKSSQNEESKVINDQP